MACIPLLARPGRGHQWVGDRQRFPLAIHATGTIRRVARAWARELWVYIADAVSDRTDIYQHSLGRTRVTFMCAAWKGGTGFSGIWGIGSSWI